MQTGKLFYPRHRVSTHLAGLINNTKEMLLGDEVRVLNVRGPASCGKSSTMAAVAQDLSKEGKLVAWWNCRGPFDMLTVLRTAVSQIEHLGIRGEIYKKHGPALCKLEHLPDDRLVDVLVEVMDTHRVLLLLDDCENIIESHSAKHFLSALIHRLAKGRVILITQNDVMYGLNLSMADFDHIKTIGCDKDAWTVPGETIQRRFPEAWAGTDKHDDLKRRYARFLEQFQTLASWKERRGLSIDLNQIASQHEALLDQCLLETIEKHLVSVYWPAVRSFLLAASVAHGPRPLAMLYSLANQCDLQGNRLVETLRILNDACLIAGQAVGAEEKDWQAWLQPSTVVQGVFHMPTAFGKLIRAGGQGTRNSIAAAHLAAGRHYEAEVRKRHLCMKDSEVGTPEAQAFVAGMEELGEAVHHLLDAGKASQSWSLLVDVRESMEKVSATSSLRRWSSEIADVLAGEQGAEELSTEIHFELCRLDEKATNLPALKKSVQNVRNIARRNAPMSVHDAARVSLYESVCALFDFDMSEAWRWISDAGQRLMPHTQGTSLQEEHKPLITDILLRQSRCALIMSNLPVALATMKGLVRLHQEAKIALQPKDLNRLYSGMAEFFLMMGFPERSRAWALAARTSAGNDPFRVATGDYWVARANVAIVELIRRCKSTSTGTKSGQKENACPVISGEMLKLPDAAKPSGPEEAALQAAREACGNLDRFNETAGTRNLWWAMEFFKVQAYVAKTDRDFAAAYGWIQRARELARQPGLRRNDIHLGLLEAKTKLEEAGALTETRKTTDTQGIKDAVARSMDALLDGDLATSACYTWALPYGMAVACELRGRAGADGPKYFERAFEIYQSRGMLSDAGRCLAWWLDHPDTPSELKPDLRFYAAVYAPEWFRVEDSRLPDPLDERLEKIAAEEAHVFLPRKWPPRGCTNRLIVRELASNLEHHLRDIKEDLSRQVNIRDDGVAESAQHEEAVQKIRRHTEYLDELRKGCEKVAATAKDIPLQKLKLRPAPRRLCDRWRVDLIFSDDHSGVILAGTSVDLAEYGVRLRVDQEGLALLPTLASNSKVKAMLTPPATVENPSGQKCSADSFFIWHKSGDVGVKFAEKLQFADGREIPCFGHVSCDERCAYGAWHV